MAEAAFSLEGDLSMASVAAAHRRAVAARKSGQLPEAIDLAGVERCDSAGLALLLEIQSWARRDGQTLSFINPPKSLEVLAELSQSGRLLGWTSEDN
jgi:phospholipid transport system transporter-binding protein